jgi:hypothetical protein
MSYDLIAFDAAPAPRDRHAFLDWISRAFRSVDSPSGVDPSLLSPGLQAWYGETRKAFPGRSDLHASDGLNEASARNAIYRFSPSAVQAAFEWENAGPAFFLGKKAAIGCKVGLFEVSGANSAVWMVSQRGRFEIAHSSEGNRSRC